MKKTLVFVLTVTTILFSCSSAKEVNSAEDLNMVNIDGIYIAENPYSMVVDNPQNITPNEQQTYFVIRFDSQVDGVIIPYVDSLIKKFSKEKIAAIQKTTYDYEKANPNDKQFIHFKLKKIGTDSISFSQSGENVFTGYEGVNLKDSLLLNYKLGMSREQQKNNSVKRPLKFIYYKK